MKLAALVVIALQIFSSNAIAAPWSGVSLNIEDYSTDWNFQTLERTADIRHLNINMEEKTTTDLSIGVNIGQMSLRIYDKFTAANTQKFDLAMTTRVLPLQRKPFKLGGAIISKKTGYAVLPLAHNAGEYWPRHSWIKWPGTIRVVIGEPIDPESKKPEEIILLVGDWINATCDKISDSRQLEKLGLK